MAAIVPLAGAGIEPVEHGDADLAARVVAARHNVAIPQKIISAFEDDLLIKETISREEFQFDLIKTCSCTTCASVWQKYTEENIPPSDHILTMCRNRENLKRIVAFDYTDDELATHNLFYREYCNLLAETQIRSAFSYYGAPYRESRLVRTFIRDEDVVVREMCPMHVARLAIDASYLNGTSIALRSIYERKKEQHGVVVGEWDSQFLHFAKRDTMTEWAQSASFTGRDSVPSTLKDLLPPADDA